MVDHLTRFGAHGSVTAITDDLYTQWQYADLIPEELRVAVKNSVGISRNDGQFDWVLRVPGERSVSAGNTGY
jgi:hypothetical protein